MVNHIEQTRGILLESAEKIGDANVFAQHHGDQIAEVAGDFKLIAEGAEMVLKGIAAAITHSKTAFESASRAGHDLGEAIDNITGLGLSPTEGTQRIMERLNQYRSDLSTSGSNMTGVEQFLAEYMPTIAKLKGRATDTIGELAQGSRTMLDESGKFGPMAKYHIALRANSL